MESGNQKEIKRNQLEEKEISLQEIRRIQERNKKKLKKAEEAERKEAEGKLSPFILASIIINAVLFIAIIIADHQTFRTMLLLAIWELIFISIHKQNPLEEKNSYPFVNRKSVIISSAVVACFIAGCLFYTIDYQHILLILSIAILGFLIIVTRNWPQRTYKKIMALQQTRTLHVLMLLLTISGILELLVQKNLLPNLIGDLVYIFAPAILFTYILRDALLIMMDSAIDMESIDMESTLSNTHRIDVPIGFWINREYSRDKNFSCIPMNHDLRDGQESNLLLSTSSNDHDKPEIFHHILLTSFGIVLVDPFPTSDSPSAIVASYDRRIAIMEEIVRKEAERKIPVYGCVCYTKEEEEDAKKLKEKIPLFEIRDLEQALIHLKNDAHRLCFLDNITLLQLYSSIEANCIKKKTKKNNRNRA